MHGQDHIFLDHSNGHKKMLLSVLMLIMLFLIDVNSLYAQSMEVELFEVDNMDLAARAKKPRKDINGKYEAIVKVQLAHNDAVFEGNVDTVVVTPGEYFVYMYKDSKKIKIKAPNKLPLTVHFGDYGHKKLKEKTTYVLRLELAERAPRIESNLIKPNGGYFEGCFQIGNLMSAGGALGWYFSNINVEANFLIGLSKSDEIFWNSSNTSESHLPTSYTYNYLNFGGKVGYGFLLSNHFRLTPQIGISMTSLKGTLQNAGESGGIKNTYVTTASMGARLHYAFTSYFGISIAPEYSFGLSKGKAFDTMADVSSKIKKLESGFNCKIGFNVFF